MGRDNTCSTARYAYERRYLVNTFGGDKHVRITLWQTTEHMDSWHPISEHTFITGRLTANIGPYCRCDNYALDQKIWRIAIMTHRLVIHASQSPAQPHLISPAIRRGASLLNRYIIIE